MAKKSLDYFSTTLEKGLKILNLFDEENTRWSQKNIAQVLQLNTTSTYRFINTLVELGYLLKDEKTKLISLGPMSVALGHRLLRSYDLRRVILPIVEDTSKQYDLSIDVAIFVNNAMVLVCRCEIKDTLTFHQPVSAEELYCTAMGKAFLAHLSKTEINETIDRQTFFPRTQKTITDRNKFIEHLSEIVINGYSVNDEEYIRGLISLGAPIFDPVTNKVVGAISFDSTIVETTLSDMVQSYSGVLKDLAAQITALMPIA